MRSSPRLWQFGICRIARAISRQTAQNQQHHADESEFWRRQIRAAWWLNGITLLAAVFAVGTVVVLICTLVDARKATVAANRAWVAPRTAYLLRELALNDHPAVRVSYDNIGRSPALNGNKAWQISIVPSELLLRSLGQLDLSETAFGQNRTSDGQISRKGAGVIWPSSRPESYSNSYEGQPNEPVITQDVLDGRAAVVVKGCILYDTFDELRKSAFCFWFLQAPPSLMLTTTTSARICPIGNDAS